MTNDLNLISGDFFDVELPKEKQYLYKYFDTEVQMKFLRYYYTFKTYDRFIEHTGTVCGRRWLRFLKNKYEKLVFIYDEAKKNMDFTLLAKIQSGKIRTRKKRKSTKKGTI